MKVYSISWAIISQHVHFDILPDTGAPNSRPMIARGTFETTDQDLRDRVAKVLLGEMPEGTFDICDTET